MISNTPLHFGCKKHSFVFFIPYFLALFFFFSISSTGAQGSQGDAAWNPNNLLLYPIEKPTRKDRRIFIHQPLPSSLTAGNLVAIRAAKGEFEPASFALASTESISNLQVSVSDLVGGSAKIPKEAIDLKIVKNWYQLWNSVQPFEVTGTNNPNSIKTLLPELLLNDDTLVQVDEMTQKNYLKVTVAGVDEYVDVSTPGALLPVDGQVFDAQTLQPFNVEPNRPRQIWLTVKVPETIPAGDYTGTITLQSGNISKILQLRVSVLPFSLSDSMIEYSLYYRAHLSVDDVSAISSETKSTTQLVLDLESMRDHGVLNPTVYQGRTTLGNYLDVRNLVSGLAKSPLYYVNYSPQKASTPSQLTSVRNAVASIKATIEGKGYSDLYVYGMDEKVGDDLLAQRAAWQVVHEAGAKMFVAGARGACALVGDLLDTFVISGQHSATQDTEIECFHGHGQRVYRYAWPQVAIEDAEIYRRWYGLLMMHQNYDGVMNYAYQHGFGGNIWNDFDSTAYKDHNFAYPTTDGVVNTIQWEGFREGVDDVRYLSTLIAVDEDNSKEDILSWVQVERQLDPDLDSLRSKIVNRIVSEPSHALSCNAITPSTWNSIPGGNAGYGTPFDVFSANAPLVDAKCTSADTHTISATIGKAGDTTRIVYTKGYYFDPGVNNWAQYTSTCTGTLNGEWCAGPTTATITDPDLSTASAGAPAYFVGMTCSAQGGNWKCGCRDTTCSAFSWQIQGAGL